MTQVDTEGAAAGPALAVAVPAEIADGERRVALVPKSVTQLRAAGVAVRVQAGAGARAYIADDAYTAAGAEVVSGDAATLLRDAAVVLKVQAPRPLASGGHEADLLPRGAVLVGMLNPTANAETLERMSARGVVAFSLDALPRITRAQDMDALSSMSTVAGYHAVLRAAARLPKFLPLLMTSAGTVLPARVLVLGAGVAGLQAIATAHRLGAVVEAFDIRAAVREQVESLGARFVDATGVAEDAEGAGGYATALSSDAQAREHEVLARHVREADVVITTALVPGRRAPLLVTRDMVESMRPGSVIVDLAAEAGGNCEASEPGRVVEVNGVTVDAPLDVSSAMPVHASQLYSHNITRFLLHLLRDGQLHLDFEDEITRATCVVRGASDAAPLAAAQKTGEVA